MSWTGFGAWALAGALIVLSGVALASIGLFVLPFALVAVALAARRWPDPGNRWGAVAGAGIPVLLVALLNLGAHPSCASSAASACVEFDIRPWIFTGLALLLGGHVAFAWRRSSLRSPTTP
jgi:hypothetical protein